MRTKSIVIALFMLVVSLALAAPTLAAEGATINSIVFNAEGCYLDVTFTVEDAGPYFATIYDDGVLLVGGGGTFPAGSTQTVRFSIGGPDATDGVAVAIRDSIASPDAYTFVNDQYWTDAQGIDCQNRSYTYGASVLGNDNCSIPLPDGSLVMNVPAGALAYYEPHLDAYAGFNLPPGTWYITKTEGDFAQVWIACQANMIWIPIANIAG